MPKLMYMEVDLREKELPTGKWGYSIRELAKACGKTENAVASAMSHAMKRGQRCRYVVVRL